jgi:hypothetical protein
MILVKILNLQRRSDRREWMMTTMFVDSESMKLEYSLAADGDEVYFENSESTTRIEHRGVVFSAEKHWPLSMQELKSLHKRWVELGYTPPDEDDLFSFYSRPINTGELGCFASHHAAWSAAVREWKDRDMMEKDTKTEDVLIVLEDDVTAVPFLTSEQYVHHLHWREVCLDYGPCTRLIDWSMLRDVLSSISARLAFCLAVAPSCCRMDAPITPANLLDTV